MLHFRSRYLELSLLLNSSRTLETMLEKSKQHDSPARGHVSQGHNLRHLPAGLNTTKYHGMFLLNRATNAFKSIEIVQLFVDWWSDSNLRVKRKQDTDTQDKPPQGLPFQKLMQYILLGSQDTRGLQLKPHLVPGSSQATCF